MRYYVRIRCVGGRTRDDERGASRKFTGRLDENEDERLRGLEADGGFLKELDVFAEGALESCWVADAVSIELPLKRETGTHQGRRQ